MKVSNNPLQVLNSTYISDLNYRDNKYVLAIKDTTRFPNVFPILFVINGDYWGIDTNEVGRINISRQKEMDFREKDFVENEVVIISGSCYPNTDNRYTHFVTERLVRQISNEDDLFYDIFPGQIDIEKNSVNFENEDRFTALFEKYRETQRAFYILESDNTLTGPFVFRQNEITSDEYIVKKQNRILFKASYNKEFVFETPKNEYTNNIRRLFLFSEDIDSLFEKAEEIDFISNKELFEWVKDEYKKLDTLQNDNSIALRLLYQWIEIVPQIKENTKRYRRFIGLLESFKLYIKEQNNFIDCISQIDEIKKEIEKLSSEKFELENEKSKLEIARNNLDTRINEMQQECSELESQSKKFKEEIEEKYKKEQQDLLDHIAELEERKKQIDSEIARKIESAEEEIRKKEEDKKATNDYLDRRRSELEQTIKRLQNDFINNQKEAHEKLSDLVKTKTHFDFIRGKKFSDHIEDVYQYEYCKIKNKEFSSYKDFRDSISKILISQNRKCESHFIDNLLISMHQNLFTLFAGLPGTGKTSMARLITTCVSGKERCVEISVGRGWTSQKDLLGFFNPLSGNFVEAHKGLHKKLRDVGEEYENGTDGDCPILYIVLDEANLSPIEHYWSMFINDTDRDCDFEIDLGHGGLIKHQNAIRFIGTINNDHTTEKISPRILDRVNIIYFKPEEVHLSEISKIVEELCVSKSTINNFFEPETDQLGEIRFKDQYDQYWEIKKLLKDKIGICLSPRIDKAMERYCKVANIYMNDHKFRPLDYFIAQRILPLINYGTKDSLDDLKSLIADMKLSKSVSLEIVDQIILQGGKEYATYDYFSILGC